MDIFGINFPELLLIMLVIMIVFGPEKLPEIMRTAGVWVRKFREMSDEVRSEVAREISGTGISDLGKEMKETLSETRKELTEAGASLQKSILESQAEITAAGETVKQTVMEQYTYHVSEEAPSTVEVTTSTTVTTTPLETEGAIETAHPEIVPAAPGIPAEGATLASESFNTPAAPAPNSTWPAIVGIQTPEDQPVPTRDKPFSSWQEALISPTGTGGKPAETYPKPVAETARAIINTTREIPLPDNLEGAADAGEPSGTTGKRVPHIANRKPRSRLNAR